VRAQTPETKEHGRRAHSVPGDAGL
jgi:hypothetical protein